MSLTLNSHIPSFTQLASCLHLPTFRSQAAIVSKISIVSLFPIEKVVTKFDLAVK